MCLSSSNFSTHKDQSPVNEAIHDKQWQNKHKSLQLNLSTHEKCECFVVSVLFSLDNGQGVGSEFRANDDSVNSAIEVGLITDDRSNCNQDDEGMVQNKDALLSHGKFVCRSNTDLCSLGGPLKCIGDNRKVVGRDDDDNLSGCTCLSTIKKKKPFNSVPRIGGRRVRK